MEQYKQGRFFSADFIGTNSWNGHEFNCLFLNHGDLEFVESARALGVAGIEDGRGVAVADFDQDGRLDLLIGNNGGAPTLYRNHMGAGRWMQLRLQGDASNRDAVGAALSLVVRQGRSRIELRRAVEAGSGYASQSQGTVHFGLGADTVPESLTIRWPSGVRTTLTEADLRDRIERCTEIVEAEADLEQASGAGA